MLTDKTYVDVIDLALLAQKRKKADVIFLYFLGLVVLFSLFGLFCIVLYVNEYQNLKTHCTLSYMPGQVCNRQPGGNVHAGIDTDPLWPKSRARTCRSGGYSQRVRARARCLYQL